MRRANKKRRKALANQARESRLAIKTLISQGERAPLHRFRVEDGQVTGGTGLYSDEESE